MNLTVIYYSSCRISDYFADAVRRALSTSIRGRFPIVSVTHRPVEFGDVRIVVGDVVPSIVRVYLNILEGCKVATTEFCAAAEDDTLYSSDHWNYRPALDTFAYNEHRVVLTRRLSEDGRHRVAEFYARPRTQMAMGIFPRELMIDALTEKFMKYPMPPSDTNIAKKAGWGEPGRYEKNLKLTHRKLERFKWTKWPNVTFNHSESLMGRRRVQPEDTIYQSVDPWGDANALWNTIHG